MRQNWQSNRIFKSFDDIVDRSLLLCLKLLDRAAMEDHVHRLPRLARRRSATLRDVLIPHGFGKIFGHNAVHVAKRFVDFGWPFPLA